MSRVRLPIGIQDFEKIVNDGYLYVDKTEYIYSLAHGDGSSYFLSRPRRFGKSLLLSTFKAYFEGKKELFKGFKIYELEKEWAEYPVLYIDFNKTNYREELAIEGVLNEHLTSWEKKYNIDSHDGALGERFRAVIEAAYNITSKRVVILVDEYDKPLLENGGEAERMEHDKAVYKGFFSTLKSYDRFIKFTFLTGVTKFSKVSIFSDLNHLVDLTTDEYNSTICGITEDEIKEYFDGLVEVMAQANNFTKEECYNELKKMYDGYHFHHNSVGVYNPFSLLNALSKKEFGMWWFETGTPTFLVEKLYKYQYDIKNITAGKVYASEATLKDYREDNPDPIPLLYQTGYLTIVDYDSRRRRYTLSYPNEEVKYGLLESLAPTYLGQNKYANSALNIFMIDEYIEEGDTESLKDVFTALYASLPYPTDNDDRIVEQNFQNVAYLVFMLLGQFVKTEVHTAKGRADVIVETDDYIYVMEFKRDSSADEALNQIEEKGYATPYKADQRKLFKIGVNFDSTKRTLDDWKVI